MESITNKLVTKKPWFEHLPPEVHLLIWERCETLDGMNLLMASPTVRRIVEHHPNRKKRNERFAYLYSRMAKIWGAKLRTHGAEIIRAMGAVSLRLLRDKYMDRPEEFREVAAPYLQDGMTAEVRKAMAVRPFRWMHHGYLKQLLEWGEQVERFCSRTDALCATPHDPKRRYSNGCQCSMGLQAYYCEDLRGKIRRALARFDSCCHAFFLGDTVLYEALRRWERWYCTWQGRMMASTQGISKHWFGGPNTWHEDLWAVDAAARLVVTHHHVLVNMVARGLGLRHTFDTYYIPFSVKPESELLSRPTDAAVDKEDSARVDVLSKRDANMEAGYCRWLSSFGLGLVDELWAMSHTELRDFTLTKYNEFASKQTPLGDPTLKVAHKIEDVPVKYTFRSDEWEACGDDSRMAYTAWYWDISCPGKLG